MRVRWFGDSAVLHEFGTGEPDVLGFHVGQGQEYVGKSCGESMFGKLWRRVLLSNWKRPLKK